MKKLLGIVVVVLTFFVIQPTKAEELASSKDSLVNSIGDFSRAVKYENIRLSDPSGFKEKVFRFTCEMKSPSHWPDELYYTKYYVYIDDWPSDYIQYKLSIKYQQSNREYLQDQTVKVLEAKGTVITFAFGNKSNPKYIYQFDYGDKTKFTIDRIKPTPENLKFPDWRHSTDCVQDKLWEDARKFHKAYHQEEDDQEQKLEAKREAKRKKEYEEKEAYDNSPEGQLHNAYLSYLLIKGYYESRKGYEMVYVTSKQMSDSKSKVKEIEETIVAKNKIDSDTIWNKAVKTYEDKEKAWMDGLISSGNFTVGNSQLAKRNLYFLTSIHNDVTGGTEIEKDF